MGGKGQESWADVVGSPYLIRQDTAGIRNNEGE